MPDNVFQRKVQARTVFISDLHLGSRGCRADLLLRFLERIDPQRVFLVGDVVDLESLRRGLYWPGSHMEVVRRLIGLARAGIPVTYVPGNHDLELREFVGTRFAEIEICEEAVHTTADGRRLLVLHGDVFDDIVHFSRWLSWIGTHLYDLTLLLSYRLGTLRRLLGLSHWSLVAYLKTRIGNARQYIESFETAVIHAARRRGFDGVVCGHIHRPRIELRDGFLYCNDGDWVESCTALIEDRAGQISLWDAGAESPAEAGAAELPALNRAA
jgi:UDP-2,3-diacylglucosamine pyrophosphatase LpxH